MPATVVPPPEQIDARAGDELVRELERLWDAPAAAPVPTRPTSAVYGFFVRALVYGWPSFLLFVSVAAPAPDGMAVPTWVEAASAGILLGVLAAGASASLPWVALSLSVLSGGLGIAVGIACRATEHHLGSWWMVETAGFAALTAASVACLTLRLRRQ